MRPLDLPLSHRSLNAGTYTLLVILGYPKYRHCTAVTSFIGHGVPSYAALVSTKADYLPAYAGSRSVLPA